MPPVGEPALHPGQGMSAMSHVIVWFPALSSRWSSGVGEEACMRMAVVLSSCTHYYIQEDRFLLCSKTAALG